MKYFFAALLALTLVLPAAPAKAALTCTEGSCGCVIRGGAAAAPNSFGANIEAARTQCQTQCNETFGAAVIGSGIRDADCRNDGGEFTCPCNCTLRDGSIPFPRGLVVPNESEFSNICTNACNLTFVGLVDHVALNAGLCSGTPDAPPPPDAAANTPTVNSGIPALENPLGTTSVPQLLGRVINAFLGITGSLALLLFIYGGFLWLTSGGNEDSIKKGKATIVWAVLGLVIIFGAYALVNFVISRALGLV